MNRKRIRMKYITIMKESVFQRISKWMPSKEWELHHKCYIELEHSSSKSEELERKFCRRQQAIQNWRYIPRLIITIKLVHSLNIRFHLWVQAKLIPILILGLMKSMKGQILGTRWEIPIMEGTNFKTLKHMMGFSIKMIFQLRYH